MITAGAYFRVGIDRYLSHVFFVVVVFFFVGYLFYTINNNDCVPGVYLLLANCDRAVGPASGGALKNNSVFLRRRVKEREDVFFFFFFQSPSSWVKPIAHRAYHRVAWNCSSGFNDKVIAATVTPAVELIFMAAAIVANV